MARTLATLMVSIGANTDKFNQGLTNAERKLGSFGRGASQAGAFINKNITLPLVALGGAAMAAANEVDKGLHAIRRGTGATGDALADLEKDMKTVMRTVPQGAETVGMAIADLNTRTGRTGESLQEMTFQMLNLARVTKQDVTSLIASTTRVFGDWDVATAKQADTLDYLFKVSQSTGIGVDSLAQKVVQFGAPLRQMGFDLETSAALLGKWEKEGVNAELIMGSLRIGLGKFAKAGEDAPRAFSRLIDEIKNMGSASQATALAMEIFGARAGPDMAAAIREGRFEIDDLMKSLAGSDETINKAARDTMSFGESMAVLKNQLTLAMEPLGRVLLDLFDIASPEIAKGIGYIEKLTQAFADLDPDERAKKIKMLGMVMGGGLVLTAIGKLAGALTGIIGLFKIIGGAGAGSAAGAGAGMTGMGVAAAIAAGKVALLVAALAGVGYGAHKLNEWMRDGKDFNPETGMYDDKAWGQPTRGADTMSDVLQVGGTNPYAIPKVTSGLQYFSKGGVVQGPLGSPQLAVVHGGEEVLTPGQRGGGTTNHFHFHAPVYDRNDVRRTINASVKAFRLQGVNP
jgi:phage-related minor tail protein